MRFYCRVCNLPACPLGSDNSLDAKQEIKLLWPNNYAITYRKTNQSLHNNYTRKMLNHRGASLRIPLGMLIQMCSYLSSWTTMATRGWAKLHSQT